MIEHLIKKPEIKSNPTECKESGLELVNTIDSVIGDIYHVVETRGNYTPTSFKECLFRINKNEFLIKYDPNTLEKYINEGYIIFTKDFNNELIIQNNRFIYDCKQYIKKQIGENTIEFKLPWGKYRYQKNIPFSNTELLEKMLFSIIKQPPSTIDIKDLFNTYNYINGTLVQLGISTSFLYQLILLNIEQKVNS